MADIEPSYPIADEGEDEALGVSPLSARVPDINVDVSDPEPMGLTLVTPAKRVDRTTPENSRSLALAGPFGSAPSTAQHHLFVEQDYKSALAFLLANPFAVGGSSPRLRKTRSTTKISWDLDSSSSHSKGSSKTVWNQKDTLDLIDAVKAVEDRQLLVVPSGQLSKTGQRFKGDKWKQVAELLPNCWMSNSDRFHLVCRGKFQELRRAYQAMLRNNTGRKFSTEAVSRKMKDYIDEAPSIRFITGFQDSTTSKLTENGNDSPTPKNKFIDDIYSPKDSEVGTKRIRKSNSSKSGQKQHVRRSSRIRKRSRRFESSGEEDEMMVFPPGYTSLERSSRGSRSSRASATPTTTTEGTQRVLRKRARLEPTANEDPKDDGNQVETISKLFQKNFDLLRRNIDFSTEYHLHKHLHKHFVAFEERMTGLLEKIDQKIDRLDRKVEEKLERSNELSQ